MAEMENVEDINDKTNKGEDQNSECKKLRIKIISCLCAN